MSCKYNNCKICGYKSECKIYKENAELKEDNSEWEKASDKWKSVYELTNNQLAKAKELLKMVLDWQYRCGNGHPTWQEVCVKIEQFISEVGK